MGEARKKLIAQVRSQSGWQGVIRLGFTPLFAFD